MPGTPPTSPNLGISRPADADTAAFSTQYNAITDTVDALFPSGTLASIPASGIKHRKYYATDTDQVYFDTGAAGSTGSTIGWLLLTPGTVRRLTLMNQAHIIGSDTWTTGGEDFFMVLSHAPMASGLSLAANVDQPQWWIPDTGLSSQPNDFETDATTRLKGRIRGLVMTSSSGNSGLVVTFGLYQAASGVPGSSSTVAPSMTVVSGSTAAATSAAGASVVVESAEFVMPTTGGPCCLGYKLSGGSGTANAAAMFSAQLYTYTSA